MSGRRCAHCYTPMAHSYLCLWWECWLCGGRIADEQIANRSRWQRRWDYVTGVAG